MGFRGHLDIVQFDDAIFPETPKQPFINKWMFGETSIFHIKIWYHSIETTIYKWLALGFQVHTSLRILLAHPEEITPSLRSSNHMNGSMGLQPSDSYSIGMGEGILGVYIKYP